MSKITIQTFKDGYIITDKNDVDYKYKGKQNDTIEMMSKKITELLTQERDHMIKKLLDGDV